MQGNYFYISVEDKFRKEVLHGVANEKQFKALKTMLAEPELKGSVLIDKDYNKLISLLWDLRTTIITSQMEVEEIRDANDIMTEIIKECYKALGAEL